MKKLEGILFRVKPEKLDLWKNWCKKLDTELREEAIETIVEEGNTHEFFALFEMSGEYYTIGMSKGENKPATDRPINNEHKKMLRECLEKVAPIENLYDLDTRD